MEIFLMDLCKILCRELLSDAIDNFFLTKCCHRCFYDNGSNSVAIHIPITMVPFSSDSRSAKLL